MATMRESEVDAKVHAVLRRNVANRQWNPVSIGNAAEVGRNVAVEIARELGVVVEPDEPVLPERLDLHFGTAHDSHGPSYTKSDRTDDRGLSVTVCGRTSCNAHTIDFCRLLADALIAAYNDRDKLIWHTGAPPWKGRYAIKHGSIREIAYWHSGFWTFRDDGGSQLRPEAWAYLPD